MNVSPPFLGLLNANTKGTCSVMLNAILKCLFIFLHQAYIKLFCLHTNLDAGKLLAPKNNCVFTASVIVS